MGTALFPSPDIMRQAIQASGSQIITVGLRRQLVDRTTSTPFWDYLKDLNCHILPNTAGCRTAQEAFTVAQMAREIFNTDWIKVEVVGDDYNLQPDPFELIKATEMLLNAGFTVLPYCTDDLVLCKRLADLGCKILMPWGSPIGSGKGLLNPYALKTIRDRLPDTILVVDAGIGQPAHATQALQLGYDAVLVNSAIALAQNPIQMAKAFSYAVEAGRLGYLAGNMPERDMAQASTPLMDTLFWKQTEKS